MLPPASPEFTVMEALSWPSADVGMGVDELRAQLRQVLMSFMAFFDFSLLCELKAYSKEVVLIACSKKVKVSFDFSLCYKFVVSNKNS